jgi:hypothetical protein
MLLSQHGQLVYIMLCNTLKTIRFEINCGLVSRYRFTFIMNTFSRQRIVSQRVPRTNEVQNSDGNDRMILIIQIMLPGTFIKSKLIELFEKIVCFTHRSLGTKLRSRLSISIVLLILFLIIDITPSIGNRPTKRFNTYKYLDSKCISLSYNHSIIYTTSSKQLNHESFDY